MKRVIKTFEEKRMHQLRNNCIGHNKVTVQKLFQCLKSTHENIVAFDLKDNEEHMRTRSNQEN